MRISAVLSLLTPAEKRRSVLLVVLAVLLAVFETVGVAAVMPFLAVFGNPGLIDTDPRLRWLYLAGGFGDRDDFLFFLGAGALAAIVAAGFFRAFAQYVLYRFVNMRAHSISLRLFARYLSRPYPFFLGRNSADLVRRVLSEADIVVDQCILPAVQMLAYGVLLVMMAVLLVLVDPMVAASAALILGGFYGLLYLGIRRLIGRLGEERTAANRQRHVIAAEALGGIKEIKVFGRESVYRERFGVATHRFARFRADSDSLSLVPRYVIEMIAFGAVLGLALFLIKTKGDLGAVLPVLGLYALAAYRLLPAAQSVYHGLTKLRFNLAAVAAIASDLKGEVPALPPADGPRMPFSAAIRFEDVGFTYPQAVAPALRGVSFEIPFGAAVAVVGATGAGKTTLVDLLLGLLEPGRGRITVDGTALSPGNLRSWQRNIGYVPQHTFLIDGTVAENIALGVPAEAVDQAALERAARLASIHDAIVRELPDGYRTGVGERGLRLSGGQRQRLAIARALYHDPPLLVLDEATSSLDKATETAVMEAVRNLHGRKTVVSITHKAIGAADYDAVLEVRDGTVRTRVGVA